jgi:hypothetical protein
VNLAYGPKFVIKRDRGLAKTTVHTTYILDDQVIIVQDGKGTAQMLRSCVDGYSKWKLQHNFGEKKSEYLTLGLGKNYG